eukprot:SAG11_NODE_92_length_17132_cov_10.277285_3_plen_67_part_00
MPKDRRDNLTQWPVILVLVPRYFRALQRGAKGHQWISRDAVGTRFDVRGCCQTHSRLGALRQHLDS